MMAATERLRLHWHTTHTLVELTLEYQLEDRRLLGAFGGLYERAVTASLVGTLRRLRTEVHHSPGYRGSGALPCIGSA
jgi:hypothetical protein